MREDRIAVVCISGLFVVAGVLTAADRLHAAGAEKKAPPKAAQPAPQGQPKAMPPAPMALADPLRKMGTTLVGLHVEDGNPVHQMAAVHSCAKLKNGVIQCALFDSKEEDAKLIGIEYVISEKMLSKLPEEERALWHSHAYEVKSGQLMSPGMVPIEETDLMKTLVGTYGKTWHVWSDEREDLPLGRPSLMMSFTKDGQARADLLQKRDRDYGVSTDEMKTRRAAVEAPKLVAGVDAGENGRSCRPEGTGEIKKVRGGEKKK
ncbi:MAG: DUF1264 domain-containing protein [Deltaproteobacteria bacterium]|nr:DUF1264 domain-containing protein [Deltaproteobacteria bacterium]